MSLYKNLLAVLSASCLVLSGATYASVPDFDMGTVSVSGLPSTVVHPSLSLDINGFDFDSFTLDLVFDPNALSFLSGASTVVFNGVTQPLAALPSYSESAGVDINDGAWHVRIGSFSLASVPVAGQLALNGAFKIADNAAPGIHQITASGFVSTGPISVCEECTFGGLVAVTVVPEPETWALWLGGLGLLAWRRKICIN